MSFKNIIERDLDIFINSEEFAEKILLDGKEIYGIISSSISDENKIKLGNQSNYGYGDAIYINEKEILYRTEDLEYRYKKGDQIEFNGGLYSVTLVEEDVGMTTLIIGEQAS